LTDTITVCSFLSGPKQEPEVQGTRFPTLYLPQLGQEASHVSSFAKQDLRFLIRCDLCPPINILWSLLPFPKLEIIFYDDPSEDDLDLVTGEEPPGTRMFAMAKRDRIWTSGDELVFIFVAGLLAQVGEAPRLVRVWIWVVFGVVISPDRGERRVSPFGYANAVGENDVRHSKPNQ